MPFNRRAIFTFLTLLLLALNITYVVLELRRADKLLEDSLEIEGKTLQAALDVTLENTYHNMLQLASVISEDQRVQNVFFAGKKAVESEGGNAGKQKAASVRKELLTLVLPMWQKQMNNYDARQLHFHLGPGSLSFLRVHQPDKFGDRMDNVRHTVVDVNRDHKARSGFEAGRIYSGLRGVVPVWYKDKNNQRQYIGALEAGESFAPILKSIDEKTGRGAAVLLNKDLIDNAMWDIFIKQHMGKLATNCQCYVEASSRPEISRLLTNPGFINGCTVKSSTYLLLDGSQAFAVSRFPLLDYKAVRDGSNIPVGSIILWSDITKRYNAHRNDHIFTVLYAIGSFTLFELLLVFLFRFSCQKLQETIKNQTAEITAMATKNATILNSAGDGIIGLDDNAEITFANSTALTLSGWEEHELLGKNIHELFFHASEDGQNITHQECPIINCCKNGGSSEAAGDLFQHRDGTRFPVEFTVTSFGEAGHGAVLVFRNITLRKELEEKVLWMAYHDPLTGLLNRISFEERLNWLEALAQRGKQLIAIMYIDLDGFKQINDRFGHQVGDKVICMSASRFQQVLREVDLFARIGGDEFIAALLMEQGQNDSIEIVADRMLTTINRPIILDELELHIGTSIGIAYYNPHSEETIDQAIRRADQSLYQAKHLGRNRYVLSDQ